MARREYQGGAVGTTIGGSIAASGGGTVTVASATGWPDGATGKFLVVINRGESNQEKVWITDRTGTTLTFVGADRGADGSTAASHSSGETIEHIAGATDFDEANDHINDTTNDHHTQYLNTTRHDVEARHTFGAALGTPAAAADIGTAAATGSGDNPAREDHVHKLGTGVVDGSTVELNAGAIRVKDRGIGAAKLAHGHMVMTTDISVSTIVTLDWDSETYDPEGILTTGTDTGLQVTDSADAGMYAITCDITWSTAVTTGYSGNPVLYAYILGATSTLHATGVALDAGTRWQVGFVSYLDTSMVGKLLFSASQGHGGTKTITDASLRYMRLSNG